MDIRTNESGERSVTLRTQAEVKAAYLGICAFRRQLKNRQIEPAGGRSVRRDLLKRSGSLIALTSLAGRYREVPFPLEDGGDIDMIALGAKATVQVLQDSALHQPPQGEGDFSEQPRLILSPDSILALEELATLGAGAIRITK